MLKHKSPRPPKVLLENPLTNSLVKDKHRQMHRPSFVTRKEDSMRRSCEKDRTSSLYMLTLFGKSVHTKASDTRMCRHATKDKTRDTRRYRGL